MHARRKFSPNFSDVRPGGVNVIAGEESDAFINITSGINQRATLVPLDPSDSSGNVEILGQMDLKTLVQHVRLIPLATTTPIGRSAHPKFREWPPLIICMYEA